MLKAKFKKVITYIAVIGLLIFLHFTKILLPVENIIIAIINPLASGIYSVSSGLRIAYNEKTDKRDLLDIVKILEEEVSQLTVENAKLNIVGDENQKLRQFLKFSIDNKHDYILANIVSQGSYINQQENEKSIIIDKGAKDGLEVGLGVINNQGVIIGKLVEVNNNNSKVSLVTNKECKLAAAILNQDKTIGIAEGELGLTIKMNFIPQTDEIKEGDVVVTSGLEKNIKRGFVIGKVKQIDKSSNEVWQSAVIEPLADLDDLVIVSVLLP